MASLYSFLRDKLRSAIYSSLFFTSSLPGRILFNLRLLEGSVFTLLGIFAAGISERKVEYLWVLRNLKSEGVILDVGCTGSFLCYELSARGRETFGIDPRPFKRKPPKLHFLLADVCNAPFREETFDTIVAVSTIEHVGIGFYNDPTYDRGDVLALGELTRILKREGKILLTTPLVRKYAKYRGGRLYDLKTLSRLTKRLLVENRECYVHVKGKGWIKIKEGEVRARKLIPKHERGHGVACLVLRKKEVANMRQKAKKNSCITK